MSINKIANINLETSAYYQDLSNLGVRFWSQDVGTSELRFLITRNNFPLSLSTENVRVVLALESGESFISTDDLDIENEVEGVASYIIPSDFLAVATITGKVTGQIYVTTIDGNEIVVQRKFTFNVENDLLSTIPSEEKIRYIKTFDDLRIDMVTRLGTVETALTLLEQNVADVNNARDTSITAINNLHDAKVVTFNQNFDDKMLLIDGRESDISTLATTTIADMVTKKAEFDAAVSGADLVTDSEATNWQKYKMVKDDGTRTYLTKGSFADVHSLEPGLYETVTNDTPTQGFPTDITNAAFVEIDVTKSGSGRKQIKVVQSSNSKTFVKYIHTDGLDNGWKQVAVVDSLASLETVTNSQNKANTAENNAKAYADTAIAATRKTLFSGSVSNVNSVINLVESINNYVIVIISGYCPAGSFSEVVVVPALNTTTIAIQRPNIANASGGSPYIYEMNLSITTSTKLTITSDIHNSLSSDTASGANANNFVVTRIEAIK